MMLNFVIPHPANFSFVMAATIVLSNKTPSKFAPLFIAFSYVVFDLLFFGFDTILFSVTIYFAYVAIGLVSKKLPIGYTSGIAGSIIFFVITNCNYLYVDSFYPKTIDGAIDSYIAGIPFFFPTLLSTVFYIGLYKVTTQFVQQFNYKPLYSPVQTSVQL